MTKPRKPGSLAEMVKLYARRRAAGKKAYARADALLEEIRQEMKVGQKVAGFELVDNYAEDNKVFRSHGINRFELKEDKTA